MAKSLNSVQLIGNLGADPEYKELPSGVATARFRMATSNTYKNKEGEVEEATQWHNCIAWKGLADVVGKWLKKGSKVYVQGSLQTRKYTSQVNGVEVDKYSTEIRLSEMIMLGDKEGGGSSQFAGSSASRPSNSAPLPVQDNDDLPF